MVSEVLVFPTSFAQRRIWFLSQLEPESPYYNIPAAVSLKGDLDVEALERALKEIIQRHEILRTRFENVDGEPVQVVDADAKLELSQHDLRQRPAEVREQEAQELARDAVRRPFDLAAGPLLRGHLLRLNDDEWVLVLNLHHIIADGWSIGVLITEFAELYEAFSTGKPANLPELSIQYADFSHWEREWLQGEVVGEHIAYWKKKLEGVSQQPELPHDQTRPRVHGHRGAHLDFAIDRELSEAVKAFAKRERTSLFVTLLAAFDVLLYRYTGQKDFVVGSPTANRGQVETEPLIGCFVNTLVLRADISGDPSFRELLGRVRETVQEAYVHQELPFDRLVEELQPERSLGETPLFQVMFILQNAPMPPLELPGLTLNIYEIDSGVSKFDFTLAMRETETGLVGRLEYNRDLYSAEVMERLGAQYERLLRGAVSAPSERVSRLPLLGADEQQQLLVEWNQGGEARNQDRSVTELFFAQAALTPDTIAVRGANDETLSYAELCGQVKAVATYLRQLGVGPEQLVGVCLERTPRLLVGLLGIMEAGGAYVPLDPRYPAERLRFMLTDAGARYVLSEQSLLETVAAIGSESEIVSLEEALRGTGEYDSSLSAKNLAYVLYTSGSTGRPKGVMLTHESAAAMLGWAHEQFAKEELQGVLAGTSICFDLSVFELFVPLTCGGMVIVAEDVLSLAELSNRNEVTLINTVPSAMVELLRLGAVPESVRTVNLAGEALDGGLVAAIYELPHVQAVWNLYGPTEDTTYSTAGEVARGARKPNIGRVVTGSRLYIVDERQQLVPVGAAGELVLGGVGLARGYWGRPELTAERFVPDGLSGETGGRLYRTGDLARYQRDGAAEYLGRMDQQVKLRGFRIELGEIESALLAHEWVQEAAVVAQATGSSQRLVAYVVLSGGSERSQSEVTSELQGHLGGLLPEFMLPSALVVLPALPRTPNGKLDRKELPAISQWGEARMLTSRELTPVEQLVAGIWSEVLGRPELGPEDNFFALGGHSLLATQVLSRLRTQFGVELPLRLLFETPTIASLARALQHALSAEKPLPLPPIRRAERNGVLPLSFAQQRLWFMDQLEPGQSIYNLPSAVRLTGQLDVDALRQSLNELVQRHEILRATFSNENGKPVHLIAPELQLLLPIKDLRKLSGSEQETELERLLREEGQLPFDLERGPLMRVALYQLDDDEHVLQITLHHIAGDGWSIGVMIRELSLFYEAAKNGEPAPLAELPVQYADFAVWQRDCLQGETLQYHVDYWKRELAGATPLVLPTDNPRPQVQRFRGSEERFVVPAELTASLKGIAQREGVTLFMLLLAAFETLLHRYTEQSDVTIGADIANRNRIETEGLIGFFVNMMVLRADFSDDPTFSELLKRVRRISLDGFAHQDLPLEKLVEVLQPERSLSNNPLFQVVFVLQNQPVPTIEQSDLKITPVAVDSGMVQFDLILSMTEVGNELQGRFSYDIDLFIPATIKQLAKRFQVLLESIVANPQERISNLRLLSEEETSGCSHTNFPDAMLSQKEFENLVLEISGSSLT